MKSRKNKKELTYAEAHNKAFWAYNKASRVLIWVGILNVIGLMIGIIQHSMIHPDNYYKFSVESLLGASIVKSGFQYSLCLASNSFMFRLIEIQAFNLFENPSLSFVGFISICVIIAILFAAGCVYISMQASLGKKWALYTAIGFYLFDTLMISGCYIIGEASELLWIIAGLHVIVLVFLFIALYQYYKLLEIEKRYKGKVPTIKGDEKEDEINI